MTDSPGGNYALSIRSQLTLRGMMDLTQSMNPQLSFWHRYFLSWYDYIRVYASIDGGYTWDNIWQVSAGGNSYVARDEWSRVQIDLSDYKHSQTVLIRFELGEAGTASTQDGWYLDDICIHESDPKTVSEMYIVELEERSFLINTSHQFTVQAYDPLGHLVDIPNNQFNWAVRGNIGEIDDNGLFYLHTDGIGAIVAEYSWNSDGSIVKDITNIIEVIDPAGGTTQIESGFIYNADQSHPTDGNLLFNAYLDSDPNGILTQASAGCGYSAGTWQVNIGNFHHPWSIGDTLHVDYIDKEKGEIGSLQYILQDSPQIMGAQLSPISFELKTTTTTNVNAIALIKDCNASTAEELLQQIPNAIELAYWDNTRQAYVGHTIGSPLINFEVKPGYPYFVTVTQNSVWTPTGVVPDPWPSFDLSQWMMVKLRSSMVIIELQDIKGFLNQRN